MSGTTSALQVRITAKDDASAALARIGLNAKAVGGQFDRLGDQFRELGTGSFIRVAQQAREVGRSFQSIVPPLSAITSAASVAGIVTMTANWAQFGAQMGRASARTRVSVGDLTKLRGVAEALGVSGDDAVSSLRGLGDAMTDAIGGRNNDALQYLQLLGVNVQAFAKGSLSAGDALDQVMAQLAKVGNPALTARALAALRIPESMIAVIQKGPAAVAAMKKEMESYGAVLSQDGVRAAERFTQAQARLGWAFTGLGNSIFQTVSPALSDLMTQFAEFIRLNRTDWAKAIKEGFTWITDAVKEGYAQFKAWVDDGGWTATRENLSKIGTGITTVVDALGGWKTATEVIFGLWLGAKFLGVLANVSRLATAMGLLRGAPAAAATAAAVTGGARVGGLGAAALGAGVIAGGITHPEGRAILERGVDAFQRGPRKADDDAPTGRVWSAGDAVGEAMMKLQRQFEAVFITRVPADQRLGGYPSGAALRGANDLPGADTSGAGSTPGQLEPEIEKKIRDAAAKHGVDPDFAVRIARIEGGRAGGRDLISPAGAIGTMQLMPGTARDLGVNPNNVDQNIDGGVRHLKQLLGKFDGNQRAVAAAYNAGSAGRGVAEFATTGDTSNLPRETQGYIRRLDRLTSQGGSGGYVHGRDADRPIGKPQQTSQKVPVEVTVRLAGNVPANTTASVRTPDGTRVVRALEGGIG